MGQIKGAPARFLLRNSQGRQDFIMTMLVVAMLALVVSILFFMLINYLSLRGSTANGGTDAVGNFNDNMRLIILGVCSSVFTLAGAYYLRRKAYDEHYESYVKSKESYLKAQAELGAITSDNSLPATTFVPARGSSVLTGVSTLAHPGYDDEEEDV
jgi:magnesium-transporting ATPase (P-type)